jgi:hypothetical protein
MRECGAAVDDTVRYKPKHWQKGISQDRFVKEKNLTWIDPVTKESTTNHLSYGTAHT